MGYSTKAQYCSPECKKAYRADYLKRYHAERTDYQRKRSQAYYADNSERLRAESAKWYRENADRAKAAQRDYRDRNRERVELSKRAWAEANPDKVAANRKRAKAKITAATFAEQYHRRRARKMNNGVYSVTERDMRRCLTRNNNACAYCAVQFSGDIRPTWDHVVAIARGGQHSIGNLLPVCAACNTSKWASTLTEWRKRISA
jgi:hypothetical protein